MPRCFSMRVFDRHFTSVMAVTVFFATTFFAQPLRAEGVRIAVQYGLAYLPFVVADQENIFQKQMAKAGRKETKVELIRISGSAGVNDALISNSVQLGVFGTPSLLTLWERTRGTLNVKGVAGVSLIPLVLVTNRQDVKSVADLGSNDRIATPSLISPGAFLLQMAAEKQFGKAQRTRFSDIIVPLSHPDGLAALLSNTEVTSIFTTAPYSDLALKNPKNHRVTSANDIMGGPSNLVVLGSTQAFAESHADELSGVFEALREANAWIKANPRKAAEIYLASEPSKSLDVDIVTSIIQSPENGYDVAPRGIMAYARFMHANGLLKIEPQSLDDVFLPIVKPYNGD